MNLPEKKFRWSQEKNIVLLQTRGMTFGKLIGFRVIDTVKNKTANHAHQSLVLFDCEGYVWAAPYVDDGGYYFLKTAYPSRKFTRFYREKGEI